MRSCSDRLAALDEAGIRDMLDIQLDDEARFLGHWRELLLVQDAYDDRTGHGTRRDVQRQWSQRIGEALRGAPWRAPGDVPD